MLNYRITKYKDDTLFWLWQKFGRNLTREDFADQLRTIQIGKKFLEPKKFDLQAALQKAVEA